jgi:hypothetical protein
MGTSLATRQPDVPAMARKPKTDPPTGAPKPSGPAPSPHPAIFAKLGEIERLVRPPVLPSQLERASALALSIARNAPDGVIAMLGTRLVRAIQDARAGENADNRAIALILARIRAALDRPV